jgi:hypothetical protein
MHAARAASYLRATPLPHATALVSFTLSLALIFIAAGTWSCGPGATTLFAGFLAAGCLNAVWISLADAYSRYREYQRLHALLVRHGCRPIILRAGSGSRCQRDAAMAAASKAGHREQARRYYREQGYRWYHLLPDGIADDPLFLVRPSFLKASLVPRRRIPARKRA